MIDCNVQVNRILIAVLMGAASASLARAQPLEGFHIVEGVAIIRHGLQLTPQLRLRTADRFHELAQIRSGMIATIPLLPHVDALAAGYWEPTLRRPRFPASYRLQFGAQARIPLGAKWTAQPRAMWERLNRTTGLAYRRVRLGGRLTWAGAKVAPYLYTDTFLTGAGPTLFHSSRTGAGLGWGLGKRARMELEYFYDVRRDFWGGDRQVLTTRVQFR
jgi:hypothetical protein